MTTLPGRRDQAEVPPAEPVETWATELAASLLEGPDAYAYEGPSVVWLGDPCEQFTLDYVTSPELAHRPEHRYCRCGWTEAHHG